MASALTDARRRHSVAARLSGIGFLLTVVGAAAVVTGPYPLVAMPALIVAGALTVAAVLQLVRPSRVLGRGAFPVVAVAAALAFSAETLLPWSFGAGMAEADAGGKRSVFSTLTGVFAMTACAGFGIAAALLVFGFMRADARGPRADTGDGGGSVPAPGGGSVPALPTALTVAALAGLVAGPGLTAALYTSGALLPSLAVFLTAVLTVDRPEPAGGLLADPRVVGAPVWARVRLLAAASVAYTVVVWGGGLAVSIAGDGTDVATSALGVASGAAQLAAVPLLWAVTLVAALRLRPSARLLSGAFVVAAVGVTAASVAIVVGYSPASDHYVPLLVALGLSVGVWLGAIAISLTRGWAGFERALIVAIAIVGGTGAYITGAAILGGITLLAVSGCLVVAGTRALRGRPRPVPAA
jgi:hypothetical protein